MGSVQSGFGWSPWTIAMFGISSPAPGSSTTSTTNVRSAEAPGARLPTGQVTTWSAAVQPSSELTKRMRASSPSVIATPAAADGPPLVAVRPYV